MCLVRPGQGGVMERSEVIVIGGGTAGCAAAVAAARGGRSAMLIEQFGYLGGWATAALVNPFMTHRTSDGKPLVGGSTTNSESDWMRWAGYSRTPSTPRP